MLSNLDIWPAPKVILKNHSDRQSKQLRRSPVNWHMVLLEGAFEREPYDYEATFQSVPKQAAAGRMHTAKTVPVTD